LKQQLKKNREENSKEEDELKRKRMNTEDYLRDNIKNYDHLMEEYTKEKADMDVSNFPLFLIFFWFFSERIKQNQQGTEGFGGTFQQCEF
jgi:hypothetical protein